jgi:putative transcriptional regulator
MSEKKLAGKFLVAAPNMVDPNFAKTVVYIALHSEIEGALGVVINRPSSVTMREIFEQLQVPSDGEAADIPIGWGGPVQTNHGYILHSVESDWAVTIAQTETVALSISRDIIEAMSTGTGPEQVYAALGCSSWALGQLESEIARGGWLIAPATNEVIFSLAPDKRYAAALALVGLDESPDLEPLAGAFTSGVVGHA